MLVSGFTILRNAVSLGYPFRESIRSLLPLVDELVVAIGDGDDDTWAEVRAIGDPKLRPVATTWETAALGGSVLSQQTNLALDRCRGDWAVYLQADEVLHEDDLATLRAAIERHHRRSTEALGFRYHHFYESHAVVATDVRFWYPTAVRAVRTGIGVHSVGDAAGFRLRRGRFERGLITACSGARIFHYGWCLAPGVALAKHRNLAGIFERRTVTERPAVASGHPGRLERFRGTHPAVMHGRVAAEDWGLSRASETLLGPPSGFGPASARGHWRGLRRVHLPPAAKNLWWRAVEMRSGSGAGPQARVAAAAARRFLEDHPSVDRAARAARELLRSATYARRRARLAPEERTRDALTSSTLGNHQFGNQFFQYMFLRTYAARHGLRWECTTWMGEKLYGHPASPITRRLPEFREKFEHDVDDTIIPHLAEPLRNVDLRGYFQYHTSWYRPDRDVILSLATPVGRYAEAAERQWRRLLECGRTVVALHLRRRYDGAGYFFVTPSSWYHPWLEEIWSGLEDPVLFLATDAPERVVDDFAGYAPVIGRDLGPPLDDFPFFLDFDLLTRCHRLAISNSSFSFAAAMLNRTATTFVRPVLPLQRLMPFDPWAAKPVLQDARVEDFPHVPGIRGNQLGT